MKDRKHVVRDTEFWDIHAVNEMEAMEFKLEITMTGILKYF
jgi:hypothetical protein